MVLQARSPHATTREKPIQDPVESSKGGIFPVDGHHQAPGSLNATIKKATYDAHMTQ